MSPQKSASGAPRRPVLLLLGGGMAAGKSTVREIIGQDNFWSKVRHKALPPAMCSRQQRLTRATCHAKQSSADGLQHLGDCRGVQVVSSRWSPEH